MLSKKEKRWSSKKRKIEAFLEVARLNESDKAEAKRLKVKSTVARLNHTLYQFILTTDEKPTVVYPIPDEISVGYFNRDKIYYGRRHIPGSHLG